MKLLPEVVFFIELNGSTVHCKHVEVNSFANLVFGHGYVVEQGVEQQRRHTLPPEVGAHPEAQDVTHMAV